MTAVIEWLKRRRSLAAFLVGLYVVWRLGRWVLGIGWSFGGLRFLESAPGFFADHWLVAAAVLLAVFVLVFAVVRFGIDRLGDQG